MNKFSIPTLYVDGVYPEKINKILFHLDVVAYKCENQAYRYDGWGENRPKYGGIYSSIVFREDGSWFIEALSDNVNANLVDIYEELLYQKIHNSAWAKKDFAKIFKWWNNATEEEKEASGLI